MGWVPGKVSADSAPARSAALLLALVAYTAKSRIRDDDCTIQRQAQLLALISLLPDAQQPMIAECGSQSRHHLCIQRRASTLCFPECMLHPHKHLSAHAQLQDWWE